MIESRQYTNAMVREDSPVDGSSLDICALDIDARSLLLSSIELAPNMAWNMMVGKGWDEAEPFGYLLDSLSYEIQRRLQGCRPPRKGRHPPVDDIDALVERWHAIILGLSTAHSHQGRAEADFQQDDLLFPILSAPIDALREFAAKLGEALETDQRVPFMVWSTFQKVIRPLVARLPAGKEIELKTTLAREVAELASAQLDRADLITAMAAALQWRGAESLSKVRDRLQEQQAAEPVVGAPRKKARLVGRQSCLFLTVGEGEQKAVVVL